MSEYQTDQALGEQIHKRLVEEGLETPMIDRKTHDTDGYRIDYVGTQIHDCHKTVMKCLGLDLSDDSLKDTPMRVSKMYAQEIFTGLDYSTFPKCTTIDNKMKYDEMICEKGIEVKSMCEHHFMPFIGTAAIAYIPSKKVVGLSKLNRVVRFFCRRPQVQERLTEQIMLALKIILDTDDVAVRIEAKHFCVVMRGIEDAGSSTVTSKLSGRFAKSHNPREEFFHLAQ